MTYVKASTTHKVFCFMTEEDEETQVDHWFHYRYIEGWKPEFSASIVAERSWDYR